ncbi:MAG: hypothetical protein CMP65_02160 [Flavobacteriales bacterium]|nr:hypothetical protein [Flavobacteriales bacterium]
MKIKYFLISILISISCYSQKADLTSAIIALDNKNDLQSAKKWIDIATTKINSGSTFKKPKDQSKFLYYRGLIYLKAFQSDTLISDFTLLKTASDSFIEDVALQSNFYKKSINQLSVCAYLFQDGAYKDYEKKDFNSALSKFVNAININGTAGVEKIDTFNMYNAALMAYQSENFQESIKWSEKLVNINPSDERFHLRLIRAYADMGDTDSQLKAIKNGRLNIPSSQDIIFEEVNYYLSTGDNKLLLESLDNAVKSDENNPILHLVLGNTYNQLKDFDKSKASFEMAIKLDSTYFDAYNNLASLYLDQTIDLIEKKNALSYKETSKFNSYKKQINDLYSLALPHLEACLRIDGKNKSIVSVLKEIYYKLGDSKKSIEMKKLEDSL